MTEIKISGMTCEHCQRAVQNALQSVEGVRDVRVDLAAGRASVSGDVEVSKLIAAVEEEGYKAAPAGA